MVVTRWLYQENKECGDLVGEITSYYNLDYRYECQWWMGLPEEPERVAASSLYECYKLDNGTTKYRAKVCCEGEWNDTTVRDGTRRYATVRDGTRRYATVRDGTRRYATVRDGTRRYATVRDGTRRYATVRDGTRRYATVRDGTRRYATVRDGTRRYATVRDGTRRYATVRDGTVRYGTVRYGTVRYGTVRYGTVRYGTVRYGTVRYHKTEFNPLSISLVYTQLKCLIDVARYSWSCRWCFQVSRPDRNVSPARTRLCSETTSRRPTTRSDATSTAQSRRPALPERYDRAGRRNYE